eukprot:TRINITY_DN1172_c0_g1_i3.p1 TRINITY_DN1172_c0_g1~~TRINITY_DN1172_c0_g1_i3.p1  ORF type:complete len:110 (+),score=21.67 TRINITY_DN1172_c0_g1_i3:294-623(+)
MYFRCMQGPNYSPQPHYNHQDHGNREGEGEGEGSHLWPLDIVWLRDDHVSSHDCVLGLMIMCLIGLELLVLGLHVLSGAITVSYTHLRAHETPEHLVCRLLLEKKKKTN